MVFDQTEATAPAGEITLRLRNNSTGLPHNVGVRLSRGRVRGEPNIGLSSEAAAGQTVELTVNLQPGAYWIFCNVGSHDLIPPGMVIPLTVTAP